MKYISLTRGRRAKVDNEDYLMLKGRKWYAVTKRKKWYAYGGRSTPMTHVLMTPPVGLVVDHINGDTLDNRRANLRICTHRQNLANVGARRNSKSGYRGVTYKPHARGWLAQLQDHGRFLFLGYHPTAEAAAAAYDRKAVELRGEFARLNLPPESLRRAA